MYDQQLSPIDSAFLCLSPNVSPDLIHHNLSLNYNILIKVTNIPYLFHCTSVLTGLLTSFLTPPPYLSISLLYKVIIYNTSWSLSLPNLKFLTFALRVRDSHHILAPSYICGLIFFTAVNPLAFAYLTALVWNTVSFNSLLPQLSLSPSQL